MSIALLDRLLGTTIEARAGIATLSRYQIFSTAARPVFLNSIAAGAGTYVVPDASGRFHLVGDDGARIEGTVPRTQMVDDLDAASIQAVGQTIANVLACGGDWRSWLALSPLAPEISNRADMLELEVLLEKRIGHLEEVCRRPRTHLHVEVERTAVSRARRLPPQAASYLAAHTEDWERPTLRAVMPKRILAAVRRDQFDIYENRVAVRLVDHLVAYLNKRITEVSRVLRVFAEAADYGSAAEGGSHWRQSRIYRLWGNALDAREGRTKAERTLIRLRHLRFTVGGLMDCLLYREVPPRATVSNTLEMTNILANDGHYRRVAEIWLAWARLGLTSAPRPRELFDDRQCLCQSFGRYCLLLMIRALDQVGFAPDDTARRLRADEDILLRHQGAGGSVTLRWSSRDAIVALSGDNIRSLRVVPLASSIAMLDPSAVRSFIKEADVGASRQCTTVVAYPPPASGAGHGRLGNEEARRLHALPHEVADPKRPRVGFMPVSPWDIGSVELFARLVRWTTLAPAYLAYPHSVRRPHETGIGGEAPWIEVRGDTLRVVRAPPNHPPDSLGAEKKVSGALSRLKALESERDRISDDLRTAIRNGEATGDLNPKKKSLNAEIAAAVARLDELERFAREMRAAEEQTRALLVCPTCTAIADPRRDFKAGGGARFACECGECGATWGTVACGHCGHWIPTLLPGSHAWTATRERPCDWVDKELGADVLAVPCPHAAGAPSFVCSECGRCGCDTPHGAGGDPGSAHSTE